MPYPRTLPPRAKLRHLYVDQNRSTTSLAREYGVRESTVRHTLERDARVDGVDWPLKNGGRGIRAGRAKVAAMRVGRDEVRSILVAAEIREAMEKYHLSQTGFAKVCGVSQAQISRILSSSREGGYCRRTTAQKVEAGVRALETNERRREGGARAWQKRRTA